MGRSGSCIKLEILGVTCSTVAPPYPTFRNLPMVRRRFTQIRIDGGCNPRPARDEAWNFNLGAGTGKMRVSNFHLASLQDTPP